MFWADRIVEAVQERFSEKIKKGEPLIIRDEKTASGRVCQIIKNKIQSRY
jgi:GTP1/Obg family GTP-binding protein